MMQMMQVIEFLVLGHEPLMDEKQGPTESEATIEDEPRVFVLEQNF